MMDQMRDIVSGDGPRPIPAALHVGSVAFELMTTVFERTAAPYPAYAPRSLQSIYGVRIVVGSLNTALPLDDRGWRLLDADGGVICEGILAE